MHYLSLALCFLLVLIPSPAMGPSPRVSAPRASTPVAAPDLDPLATAWDLAERLGPKDSPDTIGPRETSDIPGEDDPRVYIAKYYWTLDDVDSALRIIRRLPFYIQFEITEQLLIRPLKSGSSEAKLKLLRQTLAMKRAHGGPTSRDLGSFVWFFLDRGDFDSALEIVNLIGDPKDDHTYFFSNIWVRRAIGNAYLKANRNAEAEVQFDRALAFAQTVDQFDDDLDRTMRITFHTGIALVRLAHDFSQLGKAEKSSATFALAQQYAEEGGGTANTDFVQALIETGEIAKAERIIQASEPNSIRPSELVEAYAEAGARDKALAILDRWADRSSASAGPDGDNGVSLGLIELYLKLDEPKRAARLARPPGIGIYACDAATMIADSFVARGQPEAAIAALDAAAKQPCHPVVAKDDDEPTAYPSDGIPLSYFSGAFPSSRLPEIIDKYLQLRAYDRAQGAIERITLPQTKAAKLADMARSLNQANEPARANKALGKALLIAEGSRKTPGDVPPHPVLANIASVYAQLGEREKSLQLFERALTAERDKESYRIPLTGLGVIGVYYSQAKLGTDERISRTLREIVRARVAEHDAAVRSESGRGD